MSISSRYLYLHGFCSSPQSAKAKYFQQRFQSVGRQLVVPDLNQPSFAALTLTRQLAQVRSLITQKSSPVTLLGSSLGGLLAVLLAEQIPQVTQLVLFAPAFNFMDHWLPKLGTEALKDWKSTGQRSFYHYGYQKEEHLNYTFVEDCQLPQYRIEYLQRSLPTLILHGIQDDVIPLAASESYAAQRPWVELVQLNSDHLLANEMSTLWSRVKALVVQS